MTGDRAEIRRMGLGLALLVVVLFSAAFLAKWMGWL